jgi:hypothetical protein
MLLVLLGSGCAWLGCTSSYDPEAQFWPSLGPVSFGIGPAGPDAGSRTNPSLLGDDETDGAEGSTGTRSDGSAGAGNSTITSNPTGGESATSGGAGGGSAMRGSGTGASATGASGTGGGATATTASSGSNSATCSLSVSVTTTAPGGKYQPRNVGAIWIADDTGAFLESLDVWGNRRLSHVTAWNAATKAAGVPGNTVDAVTSATLSTHRTHNVSWNCEDYNGQVVPDGTYRVYFEVTDSNNSGPNHFETFTKGPTAATAQASATNFNNIVLTFTP